MELYPGYLEDPFHHPKLLCPNSMTSASTHFANSISMGIYEKDPQNIFWNDPFHVDHGSQASSPSMGDTKLDITLEDVPNEILESSRKYEQEANKPPEKVMRRLAQNREAARKSRLRKKAYIQQLETSRIKLAQLEQELVCARQQGVYINNGHLGESTLGVTAPVNPGVAAFEMEYNHWVEEHNRLTRQLRSAIQEQVSEAELDMLVNAGIQHYETLFRIKSIAAKSDVFYVISGMWRTSAERFFLWMGGFRPSELLKILGPHLDPLTEKQEQQINALKISSGQTEEALWQGMLKLQNTLTEALMFGPTDAIPNDYMGQMVNALGQLESLSNFIKQGDLLRQQALQQMRKILTVHQAARGLVVLGDYFERLRALSSLWAARPREPA
ncbi:hypothetical protein LUZ60_003055 [Juncus effusus]|nr:hypothetical protein LUZ60_003055 [Juncus effusus]